MNIITFLPLISSVITLFLGFVVLLKGRKQKINFLFFVFTLLISLWLFFTFLIFSNKTNTDLVIFLDKTIYVWVVLMPAIIYHFATSLSPYDLPRYAKVIRALGYLISFVFLLSIPTSLFVNGVFVYKWGIHTKAQILHHVFLFYFFLYFIFWIFLMRRIYKNVKNINEKNKLKIIILSFVILVVVGSFGFLPAYEIPIFPFSYLSGVIFSMLLAYAILKYRLFDIKIILTEMLIISLWIILFVELVVTDNFSDFILKFVILFLSILLGIFLIRSMHKEVKRREEAEYIALKLQLANERLRELDRAKTDFISIASHQLRTPLTAIKGYASMILEGTYGEVSTKIRGVLDKIYRSSQRLVFLVNDLLNVSRIEQGRMKYEEEDIRIVNLVKEIYDELKVNADRKKLKFSFFVDPDDADIIVKGDYGKLRQAITNIIDNSIKYTDVGYVLISLKKDETKKYVLITIRDSGIGIDPKKLNTIFEKFERAEDAIKTHTEGSGLGLFVAKEIIKHHKGEIWADSKGKGQGAIFYIKLPIHKEL